MIILREIIDLYVIGFGIEQLLLTHHCTCTTACICCVLIVQMSLVLESHILVAYNIDGAILTHVKLRWCLVFVAVEVTRLHVCLPRKPRASVSLSPCGSGDALGSTPWCDADIRITLQGRNA